MADVVIRYSQLERLTKHLNDIVTELREAGDRTDALESAIGSPWHRRELPEKLGDAESRWNTKRSGLADDLEKIAKHAQDIYDSFQKFDEDAAKNFEGGTGA